MPEKADRTFRDGLCRYCRLAELRILMVAVSPLLNRLFQAAFQGGKRICNQASQTFRWSGSYGEWDQTGCAAAHVHRLIDYAYNSAETRN